MRVVVVGASGNVGSAVLRALAAEPRVTEVVGVSRRHPGTAEPFAGVEWHLADVGEPGDEDGLVRTLAAAMAGADAVVHLAWQIQPNRERDALRRANVAGTARVLAAVAEARVPTVVLASSVGAYSPVDDDELRSEDHPTAGVPTSHYSVDKSAQERVIQEFAAAHPETAVSWLRPALIFQRSAGAEVYRYFLGTRVPRAALAHGALPVLPWPRGMRLQAVHSDDVADAYVRAAVQGARGPFNIAAPDVVQADDVAQILGARATVEVPHRPVRIAMDAAWRSCVLAADPGWLDMGASAPLMSTRRAREVLGWEPHHTAQEAIEEIVEGIRAGDGLVTRGPMHRIDATPGQAWQATATEVTALVRAHASALAFAGTACLGTPVGEDAGMETVMDLAQGLEEEREQLVTLADLAGLPVVRRRESVRSPRLRAAPASRLAAAAGAVASTAGVWAVLVERATDLGLDHEVVARQAALSAERVSRLSDLAARAVATASDG